MTLAEQIAAAQRRLRELRRQGGPPKARPSDEQLDELLREAGLRTAHGERKFPVLGHLPPLNHEEESV